jgi:hypothetical protein
MTSFRLAGSGGRVDLLDEPVHVLIPVVTPVRAVSGVARVEQDAQHLTGIGPGVHQYWM